jgi:hypothetical protein
MSKATHATGKSLGNCARIEKQIEIWNGHTLALPARVDFVSSPRIYSASPSRVNLLPFWTHFLPALLGLSAIAFRTPRHSVRLSVLPCFALTPVLRPVVLWNFSNCLRLCIVANPYDVVRAL